MSDPAAKGHQQGTASRIHPGDRAMFDAMDRQQLYDYLFMLVKNIWRVDGLYFLGIEKRHDMEEATEVDAECWRYMGKVEAKELKRFLDLDQPDPAQALWMLRHTSWAVSHHLKSYGVEDDGAAWFTVDQCRTQLIRLDKGLEPHPCRQVREGYLQAFLQEANPALTLETVSCPPDITVQEVWCKWRITG
jgi:hypothetical protein